VKIRIVETQPHEALSELLQGKKKRNGSKEFQIGIFTLLEGGNANGSNNNRCGKTSCR
jgi:hypothetical protein